VKWLGWPVQDATWELIEHLDHCEEILREYEGTIPGSVWADAGSATKRRRAGSDIPDALGRREPVKRGRGRPRKVAP
jgi:hypothetical protein